MFFISSHYIELYVSGNIYSNVSLDFLVYDLNASHISDMIMPNCMSMLTLEYLTAFLPVLLVYHHYWVGCMYAQPRIVLWRFHGQYEIFPSEALHSGGGGGIRR